MEHAHRDTFVHPTVLGDSNIIAFHVHQGNFQLEPLVAIGSIRHAAHVQPESIVLVEVLVKCLALLVIIVPQILSSQLSIHVLTAQAILILAQAIKAHVFLVQVAFYALKVLLIHLHVLRPKVVLQDSGLRCVLAANTHLVEYVRLVPLECTAQQDLHMHSSALQVLILLARVLSQLMIVLCVLQVHSVLGMANQLPLKLTIYLFRDTCIHLEQHLWNSSRVLQALILPELLLNKPQTVFSVPQDMHVLQVRHQQLR